MSVLKSLIGATGVKQKADEARQAYLKRLVTAVSEMTEDDWAKLPDASQDWVNDAIGAIKGKTEISDPEPPAQAEEEEPAPAPKTRAKVAKEEPAEEEEPAPAPKKAPPRVAKEEPAAEEEAKPAPKAKTAFVGKPGIAKFRKAIVTALAAGKDPDYKKVITELDVDISDSYAWGITDEARKLIDILKSEGLLAK